MSAGNRCNDLQKVAFGTNKQHTTWKTLSLRTAASLVGDGVRCVHLCVIGCARVWCRGGAFVHWLRLYGCASVSLYFRCMDAVLHDKICVLGLRVIPRSLLALLTPVKPLPRR